MPAQNKKSLAELVQVLDDGTTLADILIGFGWYEKEKKRCQAKEKKARDAKKAAAAAAAAAASGQTSGTVNLNE